MEIKFRDASAVNIKTDLLVIPVREKQLDEPAIRALDQRLKGQLRQRIQKSRFTGAEGSQLHFSTAGLLPAGAIAAPRLG